MVRAQRLLDGGLPGRHGGEVTGQRIHLDVKVASRGLKAVLILETRRHLARQRLLVGPEALLQ